MNPTFVTKHNYNRARVPNIEHPQDFLLDTSHSEVIISQSKNILLEYNNLVWRGAGHCVSYDNDDVHDAEIRRSDHAGPHHGSSHLPPPDPHRGLPQHPRRSSCSVL